MDNIWSAARSWLPIQVLPGGNAWGVPGGRSGVLADVDAFELRDAQQGRFQLGSCVPRCGVQKAVDLGVLRILVLALETVGFKGGQGVNEFDQVMRAFAPENRCTRRYACELLRSELPWRNRRGDRQVAIRGGLFADALTAARSRDFFRADGGAQTDETSRFKRNQRFASAKAVGHDCFPGATQR